MMASISTRALRLPRPALALGLASLLLFGLALGSTQARVAPAAIEAWDLEQQAALSQAIAAQGNGALQTIRQEVREAVQSWALPPLPAPAEQTVAAAR